MMLDRYISHHISQAHKPADKGRLLAVLKTVSWRIVGTLDTIVISYLLTGTLEVACKVDAVDTVLDMNALQPKVSRQVAMNDVARIRLKTQSPIVAGYYRFGEAGGAFVLVDPQTRATVAAGLLGAGESGV
ncbi:MAG: DUF2061 domain-containing protein [Flavobacteriales bacterium]